MTRHQQGQVIVDPLIQAEVRSQPVTGSEIDSRLPLGFGQRLHGLETRVHIIAPQHSADAQTLALPPAGGDPGASGSFSRNVPLNYANQHRSPNQ